MMEGFTVGVEVDGMAASGICKTSRSFAVPAALDCNCVGATRRDDQSPKSTEWCFGDLQTHLTSTPRSVVKSFIDCSAQSSHPRPHLDEHESLESPAKVRKVEFIGHDESPCAPEPGVSVLEEPEVTIVELVDQLGVIVGQLEDQLAVSNIYVATLLLPMLLMQQQQQPTRLQEDVEAGPGPLKASTPREAAAGGKRRAPGSNGTGNNRCKQDKAVKGGNHQGPNSGSVGTADVSMARGAAGHGHGAASGISSNVVPQSLGATAPPRCCPSSPAAPSPANLHRSKRHRAARSTTSATTTTTTITTITTTTTTAEAATSWAASECVIPLLDPNCPPPGALLLKPAQPNPGDTTVWRLPSRLLHGTQHSARADANDYVIVKVTQCHGHELAAELAAGSPPSAATGSGCAPAPLRTEDEAQQEARTAAAVAAASAELDAAAAGTGGGDCPSALRGGVFVLPEQLLVRPSSLLGTSLCVGYDREVVAVYRYYRCGDALLWMGEMAAEATRGVAEGAASVAEAVEAVAGELYRMARDMLLLVGRAHQLGYVICDHKLENMVYDDVATCWRLIDAAAVLPCPLGSSLMGDWVYTTKYAAPEQVPSADQAAEQPLWRNASSDMFSCGVCVMEAVCYCITHFAQELDEDAADALGAALEQRRLPALHEVCCNPEAAERATAEQALDLLLGHSDGR